MNPQNKFFCNAILILTLFILVPPLASAEKIIQQAEMPFEKCLEVISISEEKLLITPTIINENNEKRVAKFKLIDGILTITCDAEENLVIVSTNFN